MCNQFNNRLGNECRFEDFEGRNNCRRRDMRTFNNNNISCQRVNLEFEEESREENKNVNCRMVDFDFDFDDCDDENDFRCSCNDENDFRCRCRR